MKRNSGYLPGAAVMLNDGKRNDCLGQILRRWTGTEENTAH